MKRLFTFIVVLSSAVALTVGPASGAAPFPDSIPLPDGFYPEGIAVGTGHEFYVGSLLDGAVFRGDLRSGEGQVFVTGAEGRVVAGLTVDRRSRLLWGVGVQDGESTVFGFDTGSGELVHEVEVEGGAFLNDVVVTRDALYATDSLADVLWTVPLSNRGAPSGDPAAIPLSGDFTFVATGPLPINLNGIDATSNGKTLIAVHSTLGVLYRIDPATGEATEIEVDGSLGSGDGIVLHGRTLYVVQNFLNQVSVVELAPGLTTGEIVEVITSDAFRIPTTAARFGADLYVVNARFDAAPPPFLGGAEVSIDYDVVRVPRA